MCFSLSESSRLLLPACLLDSCSPCPVAVSVLLISYLDDIMLINKTAVLYQHTNDHVSPFLPRRSRTWHLLVLSSGVAVQLMLALLWGMPGGLLVPGYTGWRRNH